MRKIAAQIAIATSMIMVISTQAQTADAHFVTSKMCVKGAHGHYLRYKKCMRWGRAHNDAHGVPLPPVLVAVRACESGARTRSNNPIMGTFDYKAHNGSTTASGAFQYLDSTWGGHGGYARAADAPRGVQDRRAIRDMRSGHLNQLWFASRNCWGHVYRFRQ